MSAPNSRPPINGQNAIYKGHWLSINRAVPSHLIPLKRDGAPRVTRSPDLRREASMDEAARLDMPERPAVARAEPLREGADAVNRADLLAQRNGAVRAHERLDLALGVAEEGAGKIIPRSISAENGTRGASRAVMKGSERRCRERLDAGDALLRGGRVSASSRSMPRKRRPSSLATAPVVPVPQKGSSTRSSGREDGKDNAREQCLRLLRRDAVSCRLPSLSRSSPVHSAIVQSERICTSSLPALSAS